MPEPFFAEEDDGRLEDEAHGVQLEPFFDLAQEVGDVQPLDAAIVQQVAGTQVNQLKRVKGLIRSILLHFIVNWFLVLLTDTPQSYSKGQKFFLVE